MEYHHVPLNVPDENCKFGADPPVLGIYPNLSSSPSVDLRDGQRGVLTAAVALSQSGSVGIDS